MSIAREAEPVGSLHEIREAGLDREGLLAVFRHLLIARGIEERGHILYKQGKIPGSFYTGRGNEAASVGVAMAMELHDVGAPLHRNMGVHVVRGIEPWRIFANYLGRVDGYSRGREANLHLADPALGLISMVSHLPAMLPVAVGCALAFRIREERRVAVAWFGDGASARGDTHEGMNLAGVRKLPVVFVCDNNQWAYSTPNYLQYACEHAGRPRRGLRVRGRGGRRNRRARRVSRGQAGDGQGAGRRRADADRDEDDADGRPRGARRRLVRPDGDARDLGRARPDRALPRVAPRARRPERRRGGPDDVFRAPRAGRGHAAGRAEPVARAGHAARRRLREPDELDAPHFR